jgi:(p)ppGpp synthase/HD superfamily hydrolase
MLTEKFERAFLYASHVHGGQVRKGTHVPYIAHLMAVAGTVLEYGGSEDQAIAALLHDAAEDQGGKERLNDIRNRFGEYVASLVRNCSDSLVVGEKEDWKTRKQRYLEQLAEHDEDTLLISLSDKVHNARAVLRDLRNPAIGEKVWTRFKPGREESLWNFDELAELFDRKFSVNNARRQLALEFKDLVDMLHGAWEGQAPTVRTC